MRRLAEIDTGNEEPLIALLLLLLPNLRDVKVCSVVTWSLCLTAILNIAQNEKTRSLSKLKSVSLEYVATDGDFFDFDYIRLFAALPSVTSITGYQVGSDPDDLLQSWPSCIFTKTLTNLSFVKCLINPKNVAELISSTCNLERFYYKPMESLVNPADFDPFWIRLLLLETAQNTLKSLTMLTDGQARHWMGNLAGFERLEVLETNFGFLIGDPSTSWHTPYMVLPSSIVDIKIHIDYTSDGPYYQASLQDIADHPKNFDQLKNLTVVGLADVEASTISLASIATVLEARGTTLLLQ